MLNVKSFKSELIVESPGRINLIGEHIDYNGGYVLPAAIDKTITLKFIKNNKETCEIYSSNLNESFIIDLNHLERSKEDWQNFVIGVLFHINKIKPNSVKGFDCIIDSNLPLGSGVSSSAALECGLAKGVNELFKIGLTDDEIIVLARDAEHTFVGTKCGIMDQFAVVKGKKDNLILLNCNTLDYRLIAADFDPYTIVLLNTNVSHNLASSAYNTRIEECSIALESIQKIYKNYKVLTEVPPKVVRSLKENLPEKIFNRALYVTQEQRRTLRAVHALDQNNLLKFGKLLYKSHFGLQHLYEVSCKELDFLVERTLELDYVIGSRMMGGGFGGCTINLVRKDKVSEYIQLQSVVYERQFGIQLSSIIVSIGDGVQVVK